MFYHKIKSGGVIGGHDYNIKYHDVITAVNEFFDDFNTCLNDWWYVKDKVILER